ncbi:threonine aspartase [Achlya hypogyna]|uniref:Threonine aspartase n=1 Tax=Achlya hypogyna TaxID=1202772 RepID=A0A1V9YG23_ACHHY|nr:threonine aspartase [Achlya hypogyna]
MWAVGVHIGAGRHQSAPAAVAAAETSMRQALAVAASSLRDGASAVEAAAQAVMVLEDAACTNAGSNGPCVNLTEAGVVQTDVSLVDGASGSMGCCGAVEGVRNPIQLAKALLLEAADGDRAPPVVLVGAGATARAKELGLPLVDYTATPIDTEAVAKHERQRAMYSTSELLDTVGVVCMDASGSMAAGVSSAGTALKASGRVGHAGCPHMGCVASGGTSGDDGYAWSATGRGEDIIRSRLLQQIEYRSRRQSLADAASLDRAVSRAFTDARERNNDVGIEGGVLGLVRAKMSSHKKRKRSQTEKSALHFVAAFTTPSMGIGVCSSYDAEPRGPNL